jgi:hypothetical protein
MRPVCALAILLAALLCADPAAAEVWHSEQPVAAGVDVPAEIGEVGDVEFWAPNRGVLITAGNLGVPAGIFAYDGRGWYRYATVCGGTEGRVGWVGPDEFWTISNSQLGQESFENKHPRTSLCHFKDGAVIASYGEPEGVAKSYLPMNATACSGPDDCWFAGARLPGTVNQGAFHLHWDGNSMTAVPSLLDPQPAIVDPGREVTGLAFDENNLYEGVRVQEGDSAPEESPTDPSFLHQILPSGPNPFLPLATEAPLSYGDEAAEPDQLEGFELSGAATSLWAASGSTAPPARLTVLRKAGSIPFAQVTLADPEGIFHQGDHLGGIAAEPGGETAWIGFRHAGDRAGATESATTPARLVRVAADGSLEPEVSLPAGGEGIGRKGPVGAIACPAAEQCWMATTRGWLFHLGPDPAPQDDPAMHTLIGFRPRDDSLPSVPPVSLPEDNSGALSPFEYTGQGEEPEKERRRPHRRVRALLIGVHQQLIGKSLLLFTFTLRAKAHVRIVAKRHQRVVAQTKRYTMGIGHRSLRLRLDPKRWPTSLDFQVHEVKGSKK